MACHTSSFTSLIALLLITFISVSYLLLYKSIVLQEEPSFVLSGSISDTWIQGQQSATWLVLRKGNRLPAVNGSLFPASLDLQFEKDSLLQLRNRDRYLNALVEPQGRPAGWISKPSLLSCSDITTSAIVEELGHGYTKQVDEVSLGHGTYAVKYVGLKSVDIARCIAKQVERQVCVAKAHVKFEREAAMMKQLNHTNIIKLVKQCGNGSVFLRGHRRDLALVTEVGIPLDIIQMVRLPWDARYKIAIELMSLLSYLASSPLGSLIMRDFRVEQFVMVDGRIALADLDDVDATQRSCDSDRDCPIGNRTVPCVNATCKDFNALYNLDRLYASFLSYVLRHETPIKIKGELADVALRVRNLNITAADALVRMIKTAKQLGVHDPMTSLSQGTEYFLFERTLLRGSEDGSDFYCLLSRSLHRCELAIDHLNEAVDRCMQLRPCRSIVITPHFNWLGQRIVHLKGSTL